MSLLYALPYTLPVFHFCASHENDFICLSFIFVRRTHKIHSANSPCEGGHIKSAIEQCVVLRCSTLLTTTSSSSIRDDAATSSRSAPRGIGGIHTRPAHSLSCDRPSSALCTTGWAAGALRWCVLRSGCSSTSSR